MSETERLKKVVEENESNSRFHNFAECLCESYQREELVKALDTAEAARTAAVDIYAASVAALENYDPINNGDY